IIVSWNVRDLLRAGLRSVTGGQESGVRSQDSDTCDLTTDSCPLTPELIVVDNASTDGSAEMVAAEFPQARLIANATNRGFTAANNQGLALARGRYVLFLNPDTEVVGDALTTMVAYMDGHPEVGALGPQLRYGDGSIQSSRRRFPTLATALFESTPLAWHWPVSHNPWARRYHMADTPDDQAQSVDWVVGAALLARREALDQVGGFDEGYFMYSEELDLCRRIKAAGWEIHYFPRAQIIHHEGKSSEQVVAARHIHFHTSRVRYFRKFHGPLAGEVLRFALLGMFGVEWLLEMGKWLFGSKRSLRRERLIAYARLMATGLRSPG
ncbi:MAG: glycosyltransferase family 2 protein, partial [Anaerolineae bacterium]|nr:glycosyltransferase family 2 protein [Anaerolineae bacterium]